MLPYPTWLATGTARDGAMRMPYQGSSAAGLAVHRAATSGTGLPPMRDEEINGSKSQVTVRARMDPARALPRRCGTRQKSLLPRRTRWPRT
jgi:hypothetical protein